MKICVLTSTRADYGLLYPVMKLLKQDSSITMQVIATGTHLSPEYGLTYKNIEADGFHIADKVEILLSSDTSVGVAKAMGLGTISFSESFNMLNPEWLILLGDRFEILAAAQAALVMKIPTAHLCGGDNTEGAFDDSIRHSITKMSHIHFPTNQKALERIIQLGEDPSKVFNVGSTALDYLKQIELLGKTELEKKIDFKFLEKNILVTFHPATLEGEESAEEQCENLIQALRKLPENIGQIITMPNADTDGKKITGMFKDFVKERKNAKAFASLGQQNYWSALKQVDVVIGNSSSGLYEVPSFKKATVNIGSRQEGRLKASSVIDCGVLTKEINEAINLAFATDCSNTVNPYEGENTSQKVIDKIKSIKNPQSVLKKQFFDIEAH